MPSLLLFPQSGGIALVSGAIYSGTGLPVGGVQLKLAAGAPSLIYVALPGLSGSTSGLAPTSTSGGSMTSGGLTDGMELSAGDSYFVPRSRLVSGISTISLVVPAAASGGRLFWEAV